MAKQLNIDLRVNADIKQAKANFESLQKTLFKLQESTRIDVKDESLSKAQKAAGDLARNLQQATNVNTGKLDLNKFSQSLNKSGQDLKKLHQQLTSLGPEGEQAFFKLTQSIATADASTLNLGKKLSSLGTVLKNTARWQLSSSLLHGFMGAISGAYRYAQDLNESLNNIRIVTGQNIDQMSKFAKEANNAARALSTTTTQYTDASLIYYQQGLSDEDVKRRTDATIKLANVSRQSAEEVSSQMTAIWNNFAKGNENLEYYEDVITKLGATTASSSSEIANGLSKFASVADTVGLSYEKASAALATVVAETRQSEDIVGTAFKTMFARLEGLNLGETLEDGVDLNKYSKALEAVGVSILDNNGKIKSMNDILDETGAKWQNIGKEQQIALAQTVAGVRQYTQFISLMDNYDKVLKNESVAKGSAGAVDEQAKVYAESWEAARDRVTAALETIYKQLLNDNFFIDMLNGAEKFLDFISNIIDGLGGVKGILLLISSIFMQYYAKEMPRVLSSLRDNISVITGTSERRAQALLAEAREELELNAAMESRNKQMTAVATTAEVTAKMTEALNKARKGLSQTEIEAYEYEIKLAGAIGKTTEELGKEIDLLEKKGKTKANEMIRELSRREGPASEDARTIALNNIKEEMDSVDVDQLKDRRQQLEEERNKKQADIDSTRKKLDNKEFSGKKKRTAVQNLQMDENLLKETEEEIDNIDKLLGNNEKKTKKHHEELKKYYDTFNQHLNKTSKELFTDLEKAIKRYGKNSVIIEEAQNKIDGLNKKLAKNDLSGATKEAQKYVDKLKTIELPDNISDTLKKELIDGLNDGLEALKSGKGTDKLKAAFESFNQVLENSDMEIEAIKQHLQILGASDDDLKELSRIWEDAGKGTEEFNAKVDEIINKLGKELPQHGMKASEALTQMASAAMQVSMAFNAITNLGRIWDNEDLSTGEKIIQTMTAMGTLIPALVSAKKILTLQNLKEGASSLYVAMQQKGATAAKLLGIPVDYAKGASGWAALGPALVFVGIAVVITALIAGITAAIIALTNAESKESKAAKEANAEFEAAKKAAEDAKKAYEDLKNAVSDYDSAIKALEQCTKGTQEWRDAFQEVLDKTFQLIEAYPELLKYTNLYNTNGTLNTDVLNEAVKDAQQLSNTTNAVQLQAQNKKLIADEDLKKAEFGEGLSGDLLLKTYYSKSEQYTTTKASPYVGSPSTKEKQYDLQSSTIVGMVKDVSKQLLEDNDLRTNLLNSNNEDDQKKIIKTAISDSGILANYNLTSDSLTRATDDITNSIMQVKSEFLTLSNESERTSKSLSNAAKIINESFFGEDFSKKTTAEQLGYSQALGQKTQEVKAKSDAAEEYARKYHWGDADYNTLKVGASGKTAEEKETGKYIAEAIENYANKHGLGINKKDTISPGQNDDDRLVSFEDKANNYEEKRIDLKEVLAEQQALDLENARNAIIEQGQANAEQYQDMNQGLISYLNNQNFNEATIKDLKQLNNNSLSSIFGDEKGNINEDKVRSFLAAANNVNPEDINNEKVQDFIDNFSTGMTEAVDHAADIIPSVISSKIKNGLVDNLKIGDIEKVGEMYEKAIVSSGEAGVGTLNNLVELAGDEADEVMGALANMDLTEKGAEEVNKALSNLGVGFQLTEAQVASLKNILTETGKVTAEAAQEIYKNTSKILSSLKESGDVIEAKDYAELLKINPALSSYFTMMADGTYMLTGAARDFKTAAQTAQIAQLEMARQAAANTANAYQMLQESGVHSKDKMGNNPTWVSYEDETRAKINILMDAGNDEVKSKAVEYQAIIDSGTAKTEELNKIVSEVAGAYDELNLSAENFDNLTQKAAKEAEELATAIKEANYQNEINNAGLDYNTTENYANVLMELYEAEGLSKDAARALSIANQRLDRGLSSLNDNFEKISESLKNTNKASAEYAETISSLRNTFADLLNVADGEELSVKWIEKWANDADKMKKILNGDIEAIQEFRESAFAEMTTNVFEEVNKSAKDLFEDMAETDGKDAYDALQKLIDQLDNGKISAEGLKQELDNIGNTEIGSKIALSKEYTEALNTMLAQGILTEQQLNDIFATIGYKPKVHVGQVDQMVEIPIYKTTEEIVENDDSIGPPAPGVSRAFTRTTISRTEQIGTKKMVQRVPVAQIESADSATGNIEVVNAGPMNITPSYSSTTSGKSSDSSNKSSSNPTTKAASHDHEVNRYSNEENTIKGLSEQYDRLNKAKDKAFGKSRIQAIEAEIKHLKALREASGNYLDAIVGKGNADKMAKAIFKGENIGQMIANGSLGGTARADYNSLFGGLSASGKGVEYSAKDTDGNEWLVSDNYSLSGFNSLFGTNLQFNLDSYGNIQNKDAIYNLLQNLKNNENDAYSRIADPTAGSTTEYNKRMAYLEAIKERVDQFEETVDLMGEKADEYIDYIVSIQEKNAELITTKMEHGVNLGQKTIQRLERAIKVLGDNIYKTVEAMTTWYNATLKEGVEANKDQANTYAQAFAEAAEKIRLYDQKDGFFNENAIDPASAAELFSSIEDGYDSLIDDLWNRIEEGKTYYGNVLDYWNNKLDKVNSTIQTNTQLLEHFQTILNLLGRSADYEAIGIVLQGQLDNAQSDYTSRKAQADVAKQAYERAIQDRDNLIAQGISDETLEEYDENVLQIAFQNYQEKADAMYQSLEQYIEAANAKFENESNRLFAESEDRLTGKWGSFDALDNAMQRQRSVSDEYLTKTNQLYESNTLLRKLSQDIDKTDSRIAKGKLKAFADEIEAMKVQEKLSKTDLEIAKARYELLQAEIALEDARNAKSTVRLQRDNEGNYGYVYTADQDAVNDAEQNLADKQNDLYNLVLSQAQEYGEKMIQLRKEHDAEIRALEDAYYKEGIISREEFEMQLQDVEKKYQELEYAEKESYETAKIWLNQVGAEGQTEAWTNSFDEVITQHRLFNDESENNITELSNNIINNLNELDSQREYFTEEAKVGNEELKSSVDEIARSTDELSKKVAGKNGLADSMNTAMITAQNLATAFSNQYSELNKLIQSYVDAADRANELYLKTVNLVNAQVALNHAQAGATNVSWNAGGVSAYYGNGSSNSNGNSNNDLSIKGANSTADSNSTTKERYYRVEQIDTGHWFYAPESSVKEYRKDPKRWKVTNLKSGGYTGTWASGKTGMYTGSWSGPDIEENGKLAFLHQKELVLNADDTENLLAAVKYIRQISQIIDLQAAQSSMSSIQAAQFFNEGQALQQEVTIHAEFPNATDHNEIEEAFNNLINKASQYANRY